MKLPECIVDYKSLLSDKELREGRPEGHLIFFSSLVFAQKLYWPP